MGGVTVYGALWRILPGPLWVRILLMAAIAVAVVFVLFTWVFPWLDGIVNPIDVTVEQ